MTTQKANPLVLPTLRLAWQHRRELAAPLIVLAALNILFLNEIAAVPYWCNLLGGLLLAGFWLHVFTALHRVDLEQPDWSGERWLRWQGRHLGKVFLAAVKAFSATLIYAILPTIFFVILVMMLLPAALLSGSITLANH